MLPHYVYLEDLGGKKTHLEGVHMHQRQLTQCEICETKEMTIKMIFRFRSTVVDSVA